MSRADASPPPEDLVREVTRLRKINASLMKRVELGMNMQDGAFSLFQAATALECKVRERTLTLETTMQELARSNADLTLAKEAADAGSRAKSEFLATMSHEIRTPMNGVLGMAQLLADSTLTLVQRQRVHAIQRSATALLEVINDILDFSKVEAGRLELESIDFDLCDVVEDTMELLAGAAQSKRLELVSVLPPSLPPAFRGDPGRLRQVLTNLVANAIKFTETGSVTVRVGATVTDGAQEICIDVTDTGIGIAPDVLPRLFHSFTQADGSMARRYGGSGLGLAIARHLSRLMGGDTTAESTLGEGSTFRFTARLGMVTEAPLAVLHPLAGKRALVMADSLSLAEALLHSLSSFGMVADVVIARVTDPAALPRQTFDICLVDEGPAGTAGAASVYRELRRGGRLANVPAVRVSRAAAEDGRSTSREFAAEVGKPVRRSRLAATIAAALGLLAPERTKLPSMRSAARPLRPRVLLAEDNEVNRAVCIGFLEHAGCDVEVVCDGEEACSALEHGRFDLVFMDCQMPKLDGYDATRAIRLREAAEHRQRTPIVALTANALAEDRERCRRAGMDDFLSKPFRRAELVTIIDAWTRGPGIEAAPRPAPSPPCPRVEVECPPVAEPAVVTVVMPRTSNRPSSTSEPPLFDREALEQIRALQVPGRFDLVARLVDMFLTGTPAELDRFEAAVRAGDRAVAVRVSHTLKSSSARLGAIALSKQLAAIERRATDSGVEGLASAIEPLRRAYDTVSTVLRSELTRSAP